MQRRGRGDRVRETREGGEERGGIGEGERGWGRNTILVSRIMRFSSAPSSRQEEQCGCTFTPKPAKLFSHKAKELSSDNMDQSIADSFDTEVCFQFWPLRLQKYWGSAWIKCLFM